MIDSMCPECKHEVLPEHLSTETNEQTTDRYDSTAEMDYLSIEELMASKFHCRRCGHRECSSQEVSMSGTGIRKYSISTIIIISSYPVRGAVSSRYSIPMSSADINPECWERCSISSGVN
ncbi:hypothetical protein [Paenibacillus lautus]|uniref:hypothetical protein n=1 Tax=Paenibacillus lautus TaxID=1401 RepID=UPI0040447EEE